MIQENKYLNILNKLEQKIKKCNLPSGNKFEQFPNTKSWFLYLISMIKKQKNEYFEDWEILELRKIFRLRLKRYNEELKHKYQLVNLENNSLLQKYFKILNQVSNPLEKDILYDNYKEYYEWNQKYSEKPWKTPHPNYLTNNKRYRDQDILDCARKIFKKNVSKDEYKILFPNQEKETMINQIIELVCPSETLFKEENILIKKKLIFNNLIKYKIQLFKENITKIKKIHNIPDFIGEKYNIRRKELLNELEEEAFIIATKVNTKKQIELQQHINYWINNWDNIDVTKIENILKNKKQ